MKRTAMIASLLALLSVTPAMARMPQAGQGGSQAPAATDRGQSGQAGQAGQMTMDQGFQQADRDRDGLVSESEMRESLDAESSQGRSFRELDQGGDGTLSQEEYGRQGIAGSVGERGAAGGADEYGITREQGVTGGVSPLEGSGRTGGQAVQGEPAGGTRQHGAGGDWGLTGPGGPPEPRGDPGNIRGGGEVGDQEGAGPAEVPNVETYGGRDYDTTPEYGLPPAGAQGGSAEGPSGTYRERGSGGAEKEAGGTSGR